MSKERQAHKREELRSLILATAREIISKDGVQGLSIRKITKAIDYSPAIVYHYFKDKNEIIKILVEEGYKRILDSIRNVKRYEDEPEKEIKEVFLSYIEAALDFSEEYRAFVLNDDPEVLKKTAVLKEGISGKSPTMNMLTNTIQRGIDKGYFIPSNPELIAQVMWTSVFGLVIKLMYEKDISKEQKERLIEKYFELIFNGIIMRGEMI